MNRSRFHRWPAWKRLPPFVPVPIRTRADGWTPARQAAFIGFLAETCSVAEAAARAGCSRASAYKLRALPGAEGFAAAWDVACGKVTPSRKLTFAELKVTAIEGAIQVRLYGGRYCGLTRKPSDSALLSFVAATHRAALSRGTRPR